MSQIAHDFELLDAWALPVFGSRDDFADFVATVGAFDPAASTSPPTRALFALRLRLGALFGWDDATPRTIPGCSETTLRDRLPARLRDTAAQTAGGEPYGFAPLFHTDDEWAAELSNATVHGVLQLTWIDVGDGRWRGRLAVYVKPRGCFGSAYLMLIAPFRHLIVYPAMARQIGRAWARHTVERRLASQTQ